jgi:hypothetical protein
MEQDNEQFEKELKEYSSISSQSYNVTNLSEMDTSGDGRRSPSQWGSPIKVQDIVNEADRFSSIHPKILKSFLLFCAKGERPDVIEALLRDGVAGEASGWDVTPPLRDDYKRIKKYAEYVETFDKWVDIMYPFVDALEAILGDEYLKAVKLLTQAVKQETAWIDEYKNDVPVKPEKLRRDYVMKDIGRRCLEIVDRQAIEKTKNPQTCEEGIIKAIEVLKAHRQLINEEDSTFERFRNGWLSVERSPDNKENHLLEQLIEQYLSYGTSTEFEEIDLKQISLERQPNDMLIERYKDILQRQIPISRSLAASGSMMQFCGTALPLQLLCTQNSKFGCLAG